MLAETGYSRGIHLSNDFCIEGTRTIQFRYAESGTVPWDEKHEPLLVVLSAAYIKERRNLQGEINSDGLTRSCWKCVDM
jgi:hypothetical protein